jgi:hypothetical protein
VRSRAATDGLNFAFCFGIQLASIYKVRPLCSNGSAFGHESAGSVSFKVSSGIVEMLIYHLPCHWGEDPTRCQWKA